MEIMSDFFKDPLGTKRKEEEERKIAEIHEKGRVAANECLEAINYLDQNCDNFLSYPNHSEDEIDKFIQACKAMSKTAREALAPKEVNNLARREKETLIKIAEKLIAINDKYTNQSPIGFYAEQALIGLNDYDCLHTQSTINRFKKFRSENNTMGLYSYNKSTGIWELDEVKQTEPTIKSFSEIKPQSIEQEKNKPSTIYVYKMIFTAVGETMYVYAGKIDSKKLSGSNNNLQELAGIFSSKINEFNKDNPNKLARYDLDFENLSEEIEDNKSTTGTKIEPLKWYEQEMFKRNIIKI